jgi:hypothetical protein
MPTFQDLHIYVTGVVGRAMGSGKFEATSILSLSQEARAAFVAVFGEPEAPRAYQPPAAPTAQARGPQPIAGDFQAAARAAAQSGTLTPAADPSTFNQWADKPSYIGGKDGTKWSAPSGKLWRDTTWRELLDLAIGGDGKATKLLSWASSQAPGVDPKWRQNDIQKIGNAKAVLLMAQQMRQASMPPSEETPF